MSLKTYKTKFEMNDYQVPAEDADLVLFWHNGLGPVKAEWSINFVITPGPDHMMVFNNNELGLSFPFKVEEEKDRADLTNLQFFRVAFPRYVERPAYYISAKVEKGTQSYELQLAEDINKVAFYSLNQRMLQNLQGPASCSA
jgi:hypothetical protein